MSYITKMADFAEEGPVASVERYQKLTIRSSYESLPCYIHVFMPSISI